MSNLSPKARDLVHAGRRALQPTDADRVRLTSALRSQLGDAALPPDMGQVATAASAGGTIWPLVSVVVVGVGILGGALLFSLRSGTGRDKPRETHVAPVAAMTQATESFRAGCGSFGRATNEPRCDPARLLGSPPAGSVGCRGRDPVARDP